MAGVTDTKTELENLHIYTSNLRKASDLLRTYDIMGVIEPINKYAIPTYFMNSFEKASKVLTEINSPNLKLLVDLYHLQHISGNVTKTLEEKKNLIGHFQIAQAPNRNEPDTLGELNYSYVFQKLEDFGYDDWIGCEYKPKTSTIEGLDWISKFNYSL
ncbi:Gip [Drosophila busckii]|uniref:Gip n=2 Tax=Drosophila busckii TaxID=30019 RepID=A0A0M5JD60_DROBS|nr:Gip [Drosophila busckii]